MTRSISLLLALVLGAAPGYAQRPADSLDASAWNALGAAHNRAGSYAEALHAFERAIQLDPANVMRRFNRGLALAELGRFAQAVANFDTVIAARPGFAPAWTERGAAHAAMGRLAEARHDWERSLTVDSAYVWPHYYAGIWAVAHGRHADATPALERVVRANGFPRARIWLWAAQVRSGRVAPPPDIADSAWPGAVAGFLAGVLSADSLLSAARAQRPRVDDRDLMMAHYVIAVERLHAGDPDTARAHFDAVLRLNAPGHPAALAAQTERRAMDR